MVARLPEARPIPGLEHLPFAEVWFRDIDEAVFCDVSAGALALGKSGIEAWTTGETPDVVAFLERRGFVEVRRYVISELDTRAATPLRPSSVPLTTLAERPDLREALYAIARECYPDQPGRSETRIGSFAEWRVWGLDRHRPESYFIALEHDRPLGYGYLETEGSTVSHGFLAVRREARGRGIGGAIKRAQIEWAREHGVPALRTATEVRLTGLRALNERLGYRPLYEEIVLRGPASALDLYLF
jgi:GNAT superfamily N-acetyltransferase